MYEKVIGCLLRHFRRDKNIQLTNALYDVTRSRVTFQVRTKYRGLGLFTNIYIQLNTQKFFCSLNFSVFLSLTILHSTLMELSKWYTKFV